MSETEDRVELGRLNGAWGTGGWVKVFSLTDPPENIFEYQPWRTAGSPGLLHVRQWRRQGPRLVARLEEVATREQAESLHGTMLAIDRDRLPGAEGDNYYWHDLIGLSVYNRDGELLGEVTGLLDAGAHDVLEIGRSGGGDLLVPFVTGHFIDKVDLAGGRIDVDWLAEWTDAD
ncbi:MAG TPA: ribosome maturation factor RimM [Wenzhouxiangellaceae bacterium]|nr:ribosome maturation factor RimM [Wenzhouxiangellaceae bacterium]